MQNDKGRVRGGGGMKNSGRERPGGIDKNMKEEDWTAEQGMVHQYRGMVYAEGPRGKDREEG